MAWPPQPGIAWAVVPAALAGVGMGLALPALAGELLPERSALDAARLLAIRHAGIVVALVLLAPVIADQLDSSTELARQRGVSLLLDARISPTAKLSLAPTLFSAVNSQQPLDSLRAAFAQHRKDFTGSELTAYDQLARGSDATLIEAVDSGFHAAFLLAGLFAVLAAMAIAPGRAVRSPLVLGAVALMLVAPTAFAAIQRGSAPPPVRILPSCAPHALPRTGGITGFLQDRALEALDTLSCQMHVTREQLVLAVAGDRRAQRALGRYGRLIKSGESLAQLIAGSL
jgi:hypothetical protein